MHATRIDRKKRKSVSLHAFIESCVDAIQDSNQGPFSPLQDVDTSPIREVYVRPSPLYMGKFVADTSMLHPDILSLVSSVPPTMPSVNGVAESKMPTARRLVTEKLLPIVYPAAVSGAPFIRYRVRVDRHTTEIYPQFLIFPVQKFKKRSDSIRMTSSDSKRYTLPVQSRQTDDHERLIDVQKENADKLCLYKMGVGVVAFRVVINTLHGAGMRHTVGSDWALLWGKRISADDWRRSSVHQKVNHFPGSKNIGRKDLMHWNLSKYRAQHPEDYEFTPETFVLPQEIAAFKKYHAAGAEKQTFIVKPVASSCGKGIYLTDNISIPWREKPSIIQQYIPQPLLIDGRKFDLRVYIAVTSFNPLQVYVYEDGLVRFAPEKYPGDSSDLTSIHKHVTNYSINKHCIVSDDVEIKWDFHRFRAWMYESFPNGDLLWNTFQRDLENIVVKTLIAVEPEIERQRKIFVSHDERAQGCFELFGFDLLLDKNFKLFLIEVNIMPSLATESDVDIDVKCQLLADLLGLAGVALHDKAAAAKEFAVSSHGLNDAIELIDELLESNDLSILPHHKDAKPLLELIIQSENELYRAGKFRRIFPDAFAKNRYGHLIHDRMPLTRFMMLWEECKKKLR